MPDPRRTLADALALFRGKRYAECASLLEPLCAAGEPVGALSLAATALLKRTLVSHPHDQLLLANLGTAWKLAGDAHHDALFDSARFVRGYLLSGFGLDAAFFAELGALRRGVHLATHHPLDQSLRGGTQTVGNLLERREPAIARLRAAIEGVLADFLAQRAPAQDPPELALAPQVGQLVLLPSYLWHGTVPFSAPGERLTVAFDLSPAG